ncbi:MAG TPA: hypothetical protein VJQ82_21055 [Terriglobales bacterium]|nr:hypothetical protein [Terriglobales bacterium]
MPRATCVLLLLLTSLAAPGHAATVIAAGSKTVAACAAAVNPAAQILDHLPYPADWKVVVVCNENTWDMLMRQKGVNFISDYGFTFRPNHVTFIRAKVFLERMQYTPEQVLKHELGHIACSCDDEKVAWSWAAYPSEALGKLGTPDAHRVLGIVPAHSGSSNSKVAGY